MPKDFNPFGLPKPTAEAAVGAHDIFGYLEGHEAEVRAFADRHSDNPAAMRAARTILLRDLAREVPATAAWALDCSRTSNLHCLALMHYLHGAMAELQLEDERSRQQATPRLTEIQVEGEMRALAALSLALRSSMFVQMMPLPDDCYAICVKDEEAAAFKQELAKQQNPVILSARIRDWRHFDDADKVAEWRAVPFRLLIESVAPDSPDQFMVSIGHDDGAGSIRDEREVPSLAAHFEIDQGLPRAGFESSYLAGESVCTLTAVPGGLVHRLDDVPYIGKYEDLEQLRQADGTSNAISP
jgi:hypothetical protein